MGLFSRISKALAPPKLVTVRVNLREEPLWNQFTRIGGKITPEQVSELMRAADMGQPALFVDLTNEARQKDGHMQSVTGTRDRAVALTDHDFLTPKDATADEEKAADLCRRVRDDFDNFEFLIEHLTGAYLPGHATAEILWRKTDDGFLLPYAAEAVQTREFIFAQSNGQLRYRQTLTDTVGVDLLADNPGRIVQIQRRIVGDVPAREGLARVLVWAALFRNWSVKDWLALGEIGWKPWRIGSYKPGAQQEDIDAMTRMLERIGTRGVAVIPDTTAINVEWPKNAVSGQSTHREFFDVMGREMSKAVLGQTTSVEAGPNGDRGGVKARDEIRLDVRESDARAVAAVLRAHLYRFVVALNIPGKVRVPVPYFATEESADQKEFSEALKNLHEMGVRIPAKWAREEFGMPEPQEGEEIIEPAPAVQVPAQLGPGKGGNDPEDPNPEENPEDNPAPKGGKTAPTLPAKSAPEARTKGTLPDAGLKNGEDYTDELVKTSTAAGAKALAPTVAAMVTEVAKASSYEEASAAVARRYGALASPIELKVITEANLIMAHLAGAAAVREDTPELEGGA